MTRKIQATSKMFLLPRRVNRCPECYVDHQYYDLELDVCPECYSRKTKGESASDELKAYNIVKYGPMPGV